jgi:hypothetical protein
MTTQTDRIERIPRRGDAVLGDEAVLRVSRAGLKASPPVVTFIGRVDCGGCQQRMLWPA